MSQDSFATPGDLEPLLHPRGIAVVGASAEPGKFSTRLVPTLQACGYRGGIYPVNPRAAEVAGLPCYARLQDVPEPCDLAIVAVPARSVVDVVADAVRRGVGAAIILSAGFDEVGDEGAARAEALRALAGRIRIYGPNCPGLWQVRDGLVYTFSAQFHPGMLRAGPVGLVTQGGAMGRAVLDAMDTGLGFSFWFSTGNECDLEAGDFLAFLAEDPETHVLAVIAEGWRDGRRFLRAVERCRWAGKPVLLLKIGRTGPGGRAARGHTGLPNGDAAIAKSLLRRAGCTLVEDVDELTELARLAAAAPPPTGGGLGICSFSGGAGGLLADLAEASGIPLPALTAETRGGLAAILPDIAAVGNPTDLTTAALAEPALIEQALRLMARDPGVSALAFPLPHRLDAFDAALAPRLVATAAALDKPLAVIAMSPMFPQEDAAAILRAGGVQVFPSARLAIATLARWFRLPDGRRPAPYAVPPPGPATGAATALEAAGVPVLADAPPGRDLTLVARCDPVFGPVVGVGLDQATEFRLAPCPPEEARALLADIAADWSGPVHPGAWAAVARAVATLGPGGAEAAGEVVVRLRLTAAAPGCVALVGPEPQPLPRTDRVGARN